MAEASNFKIEDFSEPVTTTVKGAAKTGIFWDLEDYPFSVGSNLDLIYEKIKTALVELGFIKVGMMSIWAYVDEKKESSSRWCEYLHRKTWKSRLYILPGGGDKAARLERMYLDILLWRIYIRDFYGPANVIPVSDKILSHKNFVDKLDMLHERGYSVFLARPRRVVPPESSPEWPSFEFYCGFTYKLLLRDEDES